MYAVDVLACSGTSSACGSICRAPTSWPAGSRLAPRATSLGRLLELFSPSFAQLPVFETRNQTQFSRLLLLEASHDPSRNFGRIQRTAARIIESLQSSDVTAEEPAHAQVSA